MGFIQYPIKCPYCSKGSIHTYQLNFSNKIEVTEGETRKEIVHCDKCSNDFVVQGFYKIDIKGKMFKIEEQ